MSMLNNPWLHAGLGILSQAGPSRIPQGLGAVGRGGLLGIQSYQQQQQAQMANQLGQAQLGILAAKERQRKAFESEAPGMLAAMGVPEDQIAGMMAMGPEFTQSIVSGMLKHSEGAFEGTGMTAQSANYFINEQTRKFKADNPNATPEQVEAFRQQVKDDIARRHLMTPTVGFDPVTGAPRMTQPPALPDYSFGPSPVQPPSVESEAGRQLTEQELSERGYPPGTDAIWTESGVPKVLRVPSEQQQKAAHFSKRMMGAEKESFKGPQGEMLTSGLSALEENPENLTSRKQFLAAKSGALGESFVSSEYRRYLQYARTWISGLLRYDSGAAVPEEEFWRYFVTNFAMPGDDDVTIRQKQRARMREAESLAKTGRLSDGSMPWKERQEDNRKVSPTDLTPLPPLPPGAILDQ